MSQLTHLDSRRDPYKASKPRFSQEPFDTPSEENGDQDQWGPTRLEMAAGCLYQYSPAIKGLRYSAANPDLHHVHIVSEGSPTRKKRSLTVRMTIIGWLHSVSGSTNSNDAIIKKSEADERTGTEF